MEITGRRVAALLLAVLAMLVAGACGDDDDSDGGGGGGESKTGGSIKIGTVGPDKYDPVQIQTFQAFQALSPVYLPLLTFKHEEGDAGAELIPGLAEALPEVSNGRKTYKLKLREGLKYSDGSPVKASDFENTIKRLLKLAGPYSSFATVIEGAPEFQKKGNFKADIPGIETDDQTGDITINLTEADTKFDFALAEVYMAPTPAAKSPAKSLTNDPPPGAGPYALEVVNPTKEFILTRNKFFDVPGIPKGNVDKITGVVSDSVPKMTQDVIDGNLDFMTEDPAGDLLPQVRQQYPERFSEAPNPPNTYYFFLNVTLPPFDKQEAREAVNYALDSRALVRVFGGRLEPGCNFVPPGVVGYKELDCKYGDPNGAPDLEKAKQLVKQSGYEGEQVTVWTNNKDPRPAIADYYRDVLNQIGFEAKTKTLDQQVYFEQIGLKRTNAQTGFTDWFQDFPHAGDFFEPLLSTDALDAEVTFNEGFVSDPKIDKTLDDLRGEDPQKVADEWAALDDYVVNEKAYIAPYGQEKTTSFFSERMDAENCAGVHVAYKNDWTLFCLK
jgi:peptide/nickel transport system substrate-binding protein